MPVPPSDYPTAERQTLDEILEWFRGMADALIEHRASVRQATRDGSPVAARFVGMSKPDVDAHFDGQRLELERLTMLNLVASAEASITVDYFDRVRRNLKDTLSRDFQKLYDSFSPRKQLYPDFDKGGILSVLKETPGIDKNIVGQFRECLQGRHWLGHGRRWDKPVAVDQFDPDDVYNRADAILKAIPH